MKNKRDDFAVCQQHRYTTEGNIQSPLSIKYKKRFQILYFVKDFKYLLEYNLA